jgi:hypothetical protein
MNGGLIVVRAGVGMRAEAYDNLDLFDAALGQAKKNKFQPERQSFRRERKERLFDGTASLFVLMKNKAIR